VIGLVVLAASLGWSTQIPVHGHYWPDLLPAYVTFALGLAFAFVSVTIAALAGVAPEEAGLASGLINTNQQIGGAIGIALAATIFNSHSKALLKSGHSFGEAFTSGFQWAFWALIALSLAGAVAAFVLLRGTKIEVPESEPAAA